MIGTFVLQKKKTFDKCSSLFVLRSDVVNMRYVPIKKPILKVQNVVVIFSVHRLTFLFQTPFPNNVENEMCELTIYSIRLGWIPIAKGVCTHTRTHARTLARMHTRTHTPHNRDVKPKLR